MNKLKIGTLILAMGFVSFNFAGETKKAKESPVKKAEIKSEKEMTAEEYNKKFPEISQEDLTKAIADKKVLLVDVNGKKSYESGHIPGAIHFDSDTFEKNLPEDKETLIVAYCGGPGCEAWCKAADDLEAKGYKNIKHFKGGIKGWKEAGLKTEKPQAKKEG